MPILGTFLAGPYNVALTVAVGLGLFLAVRAGRTAGYFPLAWRVLLVAAVTGGLIGSTFIFLDFHTPRVGEKSNLGGLIAGIAVVILLGRWLRIGALRALDSMTVPTLVSMAIGRVGCFLAGCCAGTDTALPWGVHVDGDADAIHPVQLYETFLDLTLVAALTRWVPLKGPGQRVGVAVVSYAGIRFMTEFVRAGRSDIAGLNAVQWSVLAIGVAVATWLWYRKSASPAISVMLNGRTAGRSGIGVSGALRDAESRAFIAALVVMGTLLTVATVFSNAFVPFELTFMMTAACGIGFYAVLRHSPHWFTRPLIPSLGALFLFNTPPDSIPRKREIIVGGGVWSGVYAAVVGSNPYLGTDCAGNEANLSSSTYAHRRSTTGWFSGGIRERTSSGKRITIEGQVLAGKDGVGSIDAGNLFAPVTDVSILAGGGALTVEGQNQHVRFNVLGGQLSKVGTETAGITGSVTARTGVKSGFFTEGNLAPTQWYATTGDFTYLGVGHMVGERGGRFVFGVGVGAYLGVHIPTKNGFEIDVIGRAPGNQGKVQQPKPTLSLSMKKVF